MNAQTRELQARIGARWSEFRSRRHPPGAMWWPHPHIVRRINEIVAGEPLDGPSAGLIRRAIELAGPRIPFDLGISVGFGTAHKEAALIRAGLVRSFRMYELSEESLRQGMAMARQMGWRDRMQFIQGDAIDLVQEDACVDFVHWNHSLHHMMDVERAVQWSHRICRPGGMFFMDDYVGPNRFQWTAPMMEIGSRILALLPERYFIRRKRNGWRALASSLRGPRESKCSIARAVWLPDPRQLAAEDPSEAADSERILPSVRNRFHGAEIKLTGGVIYNMALAGILENIDDVRDRLLLDLLMVVDRLCAEAGQTLYATALAFR